MRGEVAEDAVRSNESICCRYIPEVLDPARRRNGEWGVGSGLWRWSGWYHSPLPTPLSFQALRNLLVKPFLSLQEGVEIPEEHSGLCPLDDPVIVRAGDRDDFRPGDLADRAGGDDRALALHEPRHRGNRAERARVGELDRATREV